MVDLRSSKAVTPVNIQGSVVVTIVEECKYPGVLGTWTMSWTGPPKKGYCLQKWLKLSLFFVRPLRSFNISQKLLCVFYDTVVASAILYSVVFWYISLICIATSKSDPSVSGLVSAKVASHRICS